MTGVSQYRRHAGVPDKFTPPRDRVVRSKQVPCPVCKAGVGEPCRKLDGEPTANFHPRRRGRAIQAGF